MSFIANLAQLDWTRGVGCGFSWPPRWLFARQLIYFIGLCFGQRTEPMMYAKFTALPFFCATPHHRHGVSLCDEGLCLPAKERVDSSADRLRRVHYFLGNRPPHAFPQGHVFRPEVAFVVRRALQVASEPRATNRKAPTNGRGFCLQGVINAAEIHLVRSPVDECSKTKQCPA